MLIHERKATVWLDCQPGRTKQRGGTASSARNDPLGRRTRPAEGRRIFSLGLGKTRLGSPSQWRPSFVGDDLITTNLQKKSSRGFGQPTRRSQQQRRKQEGCKRSESFQILYTTRTVRSSRV